MTVKTTISMVPGTMCDSRLWSRMAPHLGDQFELQHIAIERCFGKEAIKQKLASEITGKTNLLGFSMGGYLSMEFALQYPGRINSLVIICASDAGLAGQELAMRNQYTNWLQEHEYKGISKQRLSRFIHPDHFSDNSLVDTIQAMDRELGKPVLLNQLQETSAREPLAHKFANSQFNVLIVGAEKDSLVPQQDLMHMAELIPNSQLEIIGQSGHMLPLEQPEILAKRILRFYCNM